jgi:site-specific DNA-methyltransferase (adenine-specific)
MPTASVDLVYLDPPFMSSQRYRNMKSSGLRRGNDAFSDVWRWDDKSDSLLRELARDEESPLSRFVQAIDPLLRRNAMEAYLLFMAVRLMEMRRILKATGSLFLHCNQSASAYLRLLLDAIFGVGCYLNTIVWLYGLGGSTRDRFPRKHDDILWYAKAEKSHYFAPPLEPARSQMMRGRLKKSPDWWYIPTINNMATERTGYPTQKPLALLERIVGAASPVGGLVLDPFCGSGTTLAAAQASGRRWIGFDLSEEATVICKQRLEGLGMRDCFTFHDSVDGIKLLASIDGLHL